MLCPVQIVTKMHSLTQNRKLFLVLLSMGHGWLFRLVFSLINFVLQKHRTGSE